MSLSFLNLANTIIEFRNRLFSNLLARLHVLTLLVELIFYQCVSKIMEISIFPK